MRFAWIHVEKATHAVRRLCRVLAVTPSGYYAWMHRLPRQRERDNDRLQVHIRAIHAAGDVPFAAEVGESGRLLCTPIRSSDVATFLRGAGRDELMKRVGQRGHLAKPAHATTLLFCLEDR